METQIVAPQIETKARTDESSNLRVGIKSLLRGAAIVCMVVPYVCFRLGAALLGPVRAFAGWSQALSLVPGLTGEYLRWGFYRLALARCGDDACISFGTVISHPTASIGRTVYIGPFGSIGDVDLADDVLLGSHVSVANGGGQHGIERLDVPIREQAGQWRRITIGADTWIGDRAVVLADVGRHCVIGAGSVVTEAVPDFAIAAGIPARVLRYRNQPKEPTACPAD